MLAAERERSDITAHRLDVNARRSPFKQTNLIFQLDYRAPARARASRLKRGRKKQLPSRPRARAQGHFQTFNINGIKRETGLVSSISDQSVNEFRVVVYYETFYRSLSLSHSLSLPLSLSLSLAVLVCIAARPTRGPCRRKLQNKLLTSREPINFSLLKINSYWAR